MNERLIKEKYNVICTDIQYKEGILEFLEANSMVDYIIININLTGNIPIEELFYEIKKINNQIKIISTSNKTYNEETIMQELDENSNELFKYNKTIEIENIPLRKVSKEKNKKVYNQKTLPLNNFFPIKNIIRERRKDVISILGPNGIGKSVFSILFAKTMQEKKSIIIDFDILNNSLHFLMGIKKYEEKIKRRIQSQDLINNKSNVHNCIIHTELKIDLLPALNIIFDPNYKLSNKKLKNIIEELQNSYDLIIIDTSSETFLDYTREIINISNKAIFISGANMLEVRKSERLLEIYKKDWNIETSKINIIFNKCTNKSIDENLLREIFEEYNILGKIKLNDYYDSMINKNMTEKEKLKKEIEKIKNQINKEKYYGTNQ